MYLLVIHFSFRFYIYMNCQFGEFFKYMCSYMNHVCVFRIYTGQMYVTYSMYKSCDIMSGMVNVLCMYLAGVNIVSFPADSENIVML